jgi:hypothetical protein
MTTVKAFNDMMDQFLTELNLTFPDNKAVIKFQASFEVVRSTNPAMVLEGFMSAVKPFNKKIMARDETFITTDANTIGSIGDIDLASIWAKASDNTKDAIWQYLYTLVVLGTTISSFPKETLDMIEKMAENCAAQMQEGGGGDIMSLMNMMNNFSTNTKKDGPDRII